MCYNNRVIHQLFRFTGVHAIAIHSSASLMVRFQYCYLFKKNSFGKTLFVWEHLVFIVQICWEYLFLFACLTSIPSFMLQLDVSSRRPYRLYGHSALSSAPGTPLPACHFMYLQPLSLVYCFVFCGSRGWTAFLKWSRGLSYFTSVSYEFLGNGSTVLAPPHTTHASLGVGWDFS